MDTETRDDGPRCAWCGGPVPESLGTKPRKYCKRGCVQRAHEARRLAQAVDEAETAARVQALAAWAAPTHDDGRERTA